METPTTELLQKYHGGTAGSILNVLKALNLEIYLDDDARGYCCGYYFGYHNVSKLSSYASEAHKQGYKDGHGDRQNKD